MRLGQIARRLGKTPNEIKSAINDKGDFSLSFGTGLNTKLEDKVVEFLEKEFGVQETDNNQFNQTGPTKNTVIEVPIAISISDSAINKPAEEIQEKAAVEVNEPTNFYSNPESAQNPTDFSKEEKTITVQQIEAEAEARHIQLSGEGDMGGAQAIEFPEKDSLNYDGLPEDELIKLSQQAVTITTPEVKLQGVKVVDKIDLPEPSVKVENSNEDTLVEKTTEHKKPSKPKRRPKKRFENREQRKPKSQKKFKTPSNKEIQQLVNAANYKPKAKAVAKKKSKKKTVHSGGYSVTKRKVQVEEFSNPKKTWLGKLIYWFTHS